MKLEPYSAAWPHVLCFYSDIEGVDFKMDV
jgi:hypothetical protein